MGANGVMTELVFRASERPEPALEIRVNFGVFAGRNATQAEIDDLAHLLSGVVESFAIVAEERHEFGGAREASLRQVVIDIREDAPGLEERVLELTERWATDAIHTRSDLGELGSEL
jgi:hypothetical protein